MRVPDAIRKTVMFLGEDGPEGKIYKATAYLVSVPGGHGLINVKSASHLTETVRYPTTFMLTASHVAEKLEGKRFYVRANKRSGEMAIIECNPDTKWWYHPYDRKHVDAAAAPFWPDELADLDMEPIPLGMFASEQIIRDHNLGVGDEVFVTGLFTPTAETSRNIPIVRIGSVAMIPGEKLPFGKTLIEAYLIELGSIGGLSGSPVFVRETLQIRSGMRLKPGKFLNAINDSYPGESFDIEILHGMGRFYFLGSTVGHWDLENFTTIQAEAKNMGISPVTPAPKIEELILQGGLAELMKKRTKEILEKCNSQAIRD